jgi:hypothetical protein
VNQLSRLFAPDDVPDALRDLGGLLIGVGLFMVFVRKSSDFLGAQWGEWGLFVLLLITFAFLYGVGMLGRFAIDRYRPWAGIYIVFGIIVAPFLFAQFVDAVNGSPGAGMNVFWNFLVTAALAVAAAMLAQVRYALLLASLALVVSWSALWDKILSGGLGEHLGIYRGLLLILAALLVLGAFAFALLERESRPASPALARLPVPVRAPASDVITGAAVAAVLAGSLSFTRLASLGNPFVSFPTADSSFFWELVLLVVSVLAIGYGSWSGVRGPTYVGGIGLLNFLLIVGLDLNDSTPQGDIVGWPLALVIIGGVAFVASLLPQLRISLERNGAGPGATPAQPPDVPPPPPGAPPPA